MKHNRLWFKNRISKFVYCNDHEKGVKCDGILVENCDITVENLIKSQNERGIIFKD